MINNKKNINAIIAANRFGLGARPNEIKQATNTPKQWLISSLSNIAPPPEAPTAIEMMRLFAQYKKEKNNLKKQALSMNEAKDSAPLKPKIKPNIILQENSALLINKALQANDSINWRLLDFFSNHFSVTSNSPKMKLIAPSMDWDAIAPNLTGHFGDMLTAVVSHPAMLLYLNNEKSIGPDSINGKKRKKLGLNENLAREILELHTLGVQGGYKQTDIIGLAKAISGWSVVRTTKTDELSKDSAFLYKEKNHQPGSFVILGKEYAETKNSTNQARSVLKDLAAHPSTAEHLCTKLAKHFISDNPPRDLISSMAKTWLNTNGHLKEVYITMINSKHSWQVNTEKYKTPREFFISTLRALNVSTVATKKITRSLKHLGQTPYNAGSPAGYGDTRADWDGANALYTRIDWAVQVSKQYRKHSIIQLIHNALNSHLNKQTELIVSRAESQQQAIALLLMSPDFLHR